MKSNKVCAILGNIQEYKELGDLVAKRPLATLPFGGKYRLIDFQLSAFANAGIRNVYTVFHHKEVSSVFDHIGSGKEWGLDTLLSRYFMAFYEDFVEEKEKGQNYYSRVMDFLEKSKSDQTVFMSSNILANIDLKQVLQVHKKQEKNLTILYKKVSPEILVPENQVLELDEDNTICGTHSFNEALDKEEKVNLSLEIIVVETQWLLTSIKEAYKKDIPPSINKWLLAQLSKEATAAFEYTGYASNIHSVLSYYKANMDMLDSATFNTLFFSNNKVYTKVKNEAPTYYAKDSDVKNSQFASGSIIEGNVQGSVVSRNVTIEKDAFVKDAIVMPGSTIKRGARVEYAILDKLVVVEEGICIRGTKEKPVVIKKSTVVKENVLA